VPSLGRDFSKLWSPSAISNLGDGVRIAALPLLAASWTDDPRTVALVAAASGLPALLFGLLSGALVDRIDRRPS
jgi:MFS family permease